MCQYVISRSSIKTHGQIELVFGIKSSYRTLWHKGKFGCLQNGSNSHWHCVPNSQTHTHAHIHPFNGPFSGTTQVNRYHKGKTNLAFTEATDSEWQWHQLGHMQVCISLQTDNHASTPPLCFFTGRMPFLSPNQQRQSTEGTKTNTGLKRCLPWHTDHHDVDNLL